MSFWSENRSSMLHVIIEEVNNACSCVILFNGDKSTCQKSTLPKLSEI